MREKKSKKWLKRILLLCFSVGVGVGTLLFAECAVRIARPDINFQGTDLNLLRKNAFGQSIGWKPGASGVSFGQQVEIDAQGFRKLPEIPANVKQEKSWLLIGDSVTFGVGVEAQKTYAGLLQEKFPHIKMLHPSVVGYAAGNYRELAKHFCSGKNVPEKVILFFTLNDVYEKAIEWPKDEDLPAMQRVLAFLKGHSKLYMWLKGAFADRQQAFFRYDEALYNDEKMMKNAFDELGATIKTAKACGAQMLVVLMPYEYQLRVGKQADLAPQKKLAKYFGENDVKCIDAFEYMKSLSENPKELYLFADAMHFSEKGHKAIFDFLIKSKALEASRFSSDNEK